MRRMKKFKELWLCFVAVFLFIGCQPQTKVFDGSTELKKEVAVSAASSTTLPVFTLNWSEYPSWSVFGVLADLGQINPEKGGTHGAIETQNGVDIVLVQADYDTCITNYGEGNADAVCITNTDIPNLSRRVSSVAILVTSTSSGADALVVSNDIKSWDDLKNVTIRGLEKSVADYCFTRNVEVAGLKRSDFKFENQDPGAAAQAMQQGQTGYKAVQLWNPYKNQTLETAKDVYSFVDSSKIPNEILDMVVVSRSALDREGGRKFATAVCDAFYTFNKLLESPAERDEDLVSLGSKFSNLNANQMSQCLKETVFYATPNTGSPVFREENLRETMTKITNWCVAAEIFTSQDGRPDHDAKSSIGYGDYRNSPDSNLVFDHSFMNSYDLKQADNSSR